MITLYTFGPAFGLPDPSPFVMKADMLLKLSGQSYQAKARGLGRAPKGKLPYIEDDGVTVADSTFIRLHLERKYGVDFDRGLSAEQRGAAWATEKMLEDHFYWHLVYWRWLVDANFERGPRQFFARVPALVRSLAVPVVRRSIRQTLWKHGLGRHSDAENAVLAGHVVDALSQMLGERRYFMGDAPCGADATVFAFVAAGLCPLFESPVRSKLEATPNLVGYAQRMTAQFY